jgi:hypothetical protein
MRQNIIFIQVHERPGVIEAQVVEAATLGDLRKAIEAAGVLLAEAAQAAHAAHKFVRPEVVLNFVHSTSRGDPATSVTGGLSNA